MDRAITWAGSLTSARTHNSQCVYAVITRHRHLADGVIPPPHSSPRACWGPDLSDGVIRGVCGLHALVPADPDTHVSGLDHPHVIGAVSDRQRDGVYVLLHHVHDLRLLERRHPGRGETEQALWESRSHQHSSHTPGQQLHTTISSPGFSSTLCHGRGSSHANSLVLL